MDVLIFFSISFGDILVKYITFNFVTQNLTSSNERSSWKIVEINTKRVHLDFHSFVTTNFKEIYL